MMKTTATTPVQLQGVSVERYGNWILTVSGKKFWTLDPRPEDVCMEDIAQALANKCRFAGQIRRFYSVAQHSVLVSNNCDKQDAVWGLLHDAAEAYLVDLVSPLKILPEFKFFVELEDRVQSAVCKRFGLSDVMPTSVHVADKRMLLTEKRDVVNYQISRDEWQIKHAELESYDGFTIRPMLPLEAKQLFLDRFDELSKPSELSRI